MIEAMHTPPQKLGFALFTIWAILAHYPVLLVQVNGLDFDRRAAADHAVMVAADVLLGNKQSTLSKTIAYERAIRRGEYEFFDKYEFEGHRSLRYVASAPASVQSTAN